MRKWAEIKNGLVVGVHEMPNNLVPEFNPNSFLYVIEVTGRNPMPAANWKYDIDLDEFSVPAAVYDNPITSKAFFQRLTGAERAGFCSSVDTFVQQFKYWLSLTGDVDLSDSDVIAGVGILEDPKAIIGAGRAVEILIIEEI